MSGDEASSGGDDTDSGGGNRANVLLRALRVVVPDFLRRRYALKFAVVLLVMGAVIGGIGAVATAQLSDQIQDRTEGEYRNLAEQEANLVTQWVQQNRRTVEHLSSENITRSENATAIQVTFRERINNDLALDVKSLYLFNRSQSGHNIIARHLAGGVPTMEQAGRGWVSDLQFSGNESVRVSSAYRRPEGSNVVVGFVSPVDGAFNRYLLMEVSVGSLASDFQGNESASGGFTQVVNASGTVLIDEQAANPTIRQDDQLASYGSRSARKPVRKALNLKDKSSEVMQMDANSQVLDEEYVVGYAPVLVTGSDENWVVLVHAPTSEVFGFVQTVSNWGMIATAAGVLLIALIGAVLGYNTSSSIDRLTRKAEQMEEGNLDVDVRTGRIDNIGRLYDAFGEMRDALKQQIQEAEQARKEAEVSRAEAMEMNNYLQEKAEEYSDIMQACARGDLTRRMEAEGENEAMDRIAEEFNDMIGELEMTTGQLKTFAVEVEESGRSVQQSAETVRDASEQVADSIQKISDDAYDQKERLRSISEDMDEVADQLESFAERHPDVEFDESLDTVRDVANMVDEAADLGEETMAESENVAGAAEEQAAELNEVSASAEELVRYASYLGDGLNNFETEEEHEFVFQTGAESPGSDAGESEGDGE